MTVQSITRPLQTDDITIMSHVTSVTAVGNKISKLTTKPDNSTTIHLNFDVKGRKDEPCILAGAEELGLIINAQDALEIGLYLVAMAIKNPTEKEVAEIQSQLSATIAEMNPI